MFCFSLQFPGIVLLVSKLYESGRLITHHSSVISISGGCGIDHLGISVSLITSRPLKVAQQPRLL